MFTAQFIADQARNAGLDVYTAPSEDSDFTTIRISGVDSLHLIVTTRWDGRSEEVYTAKLIEPHWEGGSHVFRPQLDQVDRFSGAHSYALLGWVVTQVQDLVDTKARYERREAQYTLNLQARKAAKKADVRKNRRVWRELQARKVAA